MQRDLDTRRDWGEAQGNYDEFRFFTGMRPSEQIALLVDDCDLSLGKIKVSKACVMKRDKGAAGTVEVGWEDRSQPSVLSRRRDTNSGSELSVRSMARDVVDDS